MKSDNTIAVSKLKTDCLEVLDRVVETGEELIVTKRGRPVARLVPIPKKPKKGWRSPLLGLITYHGDIVAPLGDIWECER